MDPLDEQIEATLAMIRMAGGEAGIDPDAPPEIKRAFLEMIWNCPDCREAFLRLGGHSRNN